VVSWHKLCARDTDCLTGLAEVAAKDARVLRTIWNSPRCGKEVWRVAVVVRGTDLRQKC
jgi:hypothetical protein